MKLLFTSSGLSNASIADAFVQLVGKPAHEIKVAFIPTAALGEIDDKGGLIVDMHRMYELGCRIDIVEIAQLTQEEWLPRLERSDVIFVSGGNAFYLSYWLHKSGVAAKLPELLETRVYASVSAGGLVAGPTLGFTTQASAEPEAFAAKDSDKLGPKGRVGYDTLNFADFIVRPHFNNSEYPYAAEDYLAKRAEKTDKTIYAIDDDTAVQVIDNEITVISEGTWQKFN